MLARVERTRKFRAAYGRRSGVRVPSPASNFTVIYRTRGTRNSYPTLSSDGVRAFNMENLSFIRTIAQINDLLG